MRRPYRAIIAALAVVLLPSLAPPAAEALPLTQPDGTAMVNGPVRTIAQAGSVIWVGGSFTQANDPGGVDVAVDNLVPIDDATGLLDASLHIPSVTSSGGTAIIYDASVGPDGALYFTGQFSAVDGAPRQNVAAIDATTGALLPFTADTGRGTSVLATSSNVFVGGGRLRSFEYDGTATPGFVPPTLGIDPNLRGHTTTPNVRDIAEVDADTLVVACQCDRLTDRGGTENVKAVVEIDAATGDLLNWSPGGGLPGDSAAFGISVIVHDAPGSGNPTVYLAAGGSDFTAAFDAASGLQRWHTDTSGSSQAIVWYEGQLIVGGHFDWTQKPGGNTCGSNDGPNLACYHSPKLVAMDPSSGHVILDGSGDPWNPGICCKYNGVWALLPDAAAGALHVGGEFTQMGGTWSGSGVNWTLHGESSQDYYGRLSDVSSPDRLLTVTLAGTGAGSVESVPAAIQCGAACQVVFPAGTQVTLAATAVPGSGFTGWSGDCTGTDDCQLTMDRVSQVTATFDLVQSGACGRIAFVSDRSGNNDIFTMNDDGSDVIQVTTDPGSDVSPSWSPDCTEIVFTSLREGLPHLYVIGADGTGERALTSGTTWSDQQPTWSATGPIAFISDRFGQNDLFTINEDGSGLTRLTTNPGSDKDPSWGPGGTRIAFASNRSGVYQIYTMGLATKDLKLLTTGLTPSRQPAWSRGGAKIAFVGSSTGSAQIWIMGRDGSAPVCLTSDTGPDSHPSWSRWGGRIVYAAGSASEIRMVGLDGTGSKSISDTPVSGSLPTWS